MIIENMINQCMKRIGVARNDYKRSIYSIAFGEKMKGRGRIKTVRCRKVCKTRTGDKKKYIYVPVQSEDASLYIEIIVAILTVVFMFIVVKKCI